MVAVELANLLALFRSTVGYGLCETGKNRMTTCALERLVLKSGMQKVCAEEFRGGFLQLLRVGEQKMTVGRLDVTPCFKYSHLSIAIQRLAGLER